MNLNFTSRANILIALAVLALAIIVIGLWSLLRQGPDASRFTYDGAVKARGAAVYKQYCAVCHGINLEGQLNWRTRLPNGRMPAPPHNEHGHTWHHPDAVLFDIVKHGFIPGRNAPDGHQSDMPAYGTVLSDQDVVAVLTFIKSTWPREIQDMQASVTREFHANHMTSTR